MADKNTFRVLSPTAILGYGYPLASFEAGLRRKPDLIGVDAGSTDPGPYYLGSGKSFTDRACVKRDLRPMLRAGIDNKIPVVIGSAGGAGAEMHLAWCREIVEEIAAEERLSFRLGLAHAEIEKSVVSKALQEGRIKALPGITPLTEDAIKESTSIVAQMGMGPIQELLAGGCEVVLCGRCYDPAVFAALPAARGFDTGLALHMGKILECAAIAATPGSGSDCAFGELTEDGFILSALSPERVFTCESTSAHTLYEKSDPYHLPGPGGELNLEDCTFTALGSGRVQVQGSVFVPSARECVKLEGARRVGFRTVSIAGTRDPIMIRQIREVLLAVENQVERLLKGEGVTGRMQFHVYGLDGVMGPREPQKVTQAHELGIVIEAIGATQAEADTVCSIARSSLLHYGYPGRIATAGNLAFPFSPSDMQAGPVYEFCIYHLLETEGEDLFPVEVLDVGS